MVSTSSYISGTSIASSITQDLYLSIFSTDHALGVSSRMLGNGQLHPHYPLDRFVVHSFIGSVLCVSSAGQLSIAVDDLSLNLGKCSELMTLTAMTTPAKRKFSAYHSIGSQLFHISGSHVSVFLSHMYYEC